ncbi:MAG: bacterial transcriptional activator domain-containing protein, partial [Nitrospiraceae bacterium]|nr:bacterial transcriptional activator domain-containing protein [Nitrospiraceae bacterium]
MRTGQWEAAIEKFEKGLEMDNLVEEIYQDLMLCQISLGRHAEAARTYEQCRKALSETLGINPSPSTNNIYKSIF